MVPDEFRIVSSSWPNVLTKYPRAQNCILPKFRRFPLTTPANKKAGNMRAEEIRNWLIERIGRLWNLPASEIHPNNTFSQFGMDSLRMTQVAAELSKLLEKPLALTLLWEYPTIAALAEHLGSGSLSPSAARSKPAILRPRHEPIAVVGIACRFPGARDPKEFWQLLSSGRDAIVEVPKDRWDADAFYDPDPNAPGKMNTKWGGFLDRIDLFDSHFFGISPREAHQMDPQQRLMIELAWEALEDAGIPPARLRGSPTGIFFGAIWHDYAELLGGQLAAVEPHTATGQALNIIANRVSYVLDARGPSVVVDSACSSSLFAVHLACRSLLEDETSLALAGGVNLIITPGTMVGLSKLGALSPDGRSKAFDASANGFGRGEGGGIIVLKRLSKALADGNSIYCVIRSTAVNNDGASNGLTAPNPGAQQAVLRAAYQAAQIPPERVDYVETHGTGTRLGDPIEIQSLAAVLGAGRTPGRPLLVGSVKTNIGHLEGAAGIAGLIKTALAIKHKAIPASLHFQQPNPLIPFDALNVNVAQALQPWPTTGHLPLAGISSFGWGGTNAHVVVEGVADSPLLFCALSAENEGALYAQATLLLNAMSTSQEELRTLLNKLSPRTEEQPHRLAFVVRSRQELTAKLEQFRRRQPVSGLSSGQADVNPRKPVFVCSPQGSQWLGMARRLLRTEPVFRAAVFQYDCEFQQYANFSLIDELFADEASARFGDVDVVQPLLCAIQIALAALWRSWGVEPAVVIGHSMGEISAAHIAGILSLPATVRVIYHYSRLQKRMAGHGGMALVELPAEELRPLVIARNPELCIASYNSPTSTVLAGTESALESALAEFKLRGIPFAKIRVNVAAHSPQMEPILDELTQVLDGITPQRASVPMISTLTGLPLDGNEVNASYFPRNLREPVRLAQVMDELLAAGHETFIELSPHPVLTYALKQSAKSLGSKVLIVPSFHRCEDEWAALLEVRGQLYLRGLGKGNADPIRTAATGVPLLISGKVEAALREQAGRWAAWLAEQPELPFSEFPMSAALHRTHFDHRAAVFAADRTQAIEQLSALCVGQPRSDVLVATARPRGKTVFVFSGPGSQWPAMGRALLLQSPVFAQAIDACDRALSPLTGWSVRSILHGDSDPSLPPLDCVDVVQPALFAMAVGLAALWRSWGIHPQAIVGHGEGEIAAAYLAGILSLQDAARIIALRSQLIVRRLKVNVDYASRCAEVDPVLPELRLLLQGLNPAQAKIPFFSTVTGSLVHGHELGPDYWADNLRLPVRLDLALQRLFDLSHDVFIEISPHPLLAIPLAEAASQRGALVASSLKRGLGGIDHILRMLTELHLQGLHVSWDKVCSPAGHRPLPLPTYPFQRQRFWLQASTPYTSLPPDLRDSDPPWLGSATSAESPGLQQLLLACPEADRLPLLIERVWAQVVAVLQLSTSAALPLDQPLQALGLDSLMALELRDCLERLTDLKLPDTLVFEHLCVKTISEYLYCSFLGLSELPKEVNSSPSENLVAGSVSSGAGVHRSLGGPRARMRLFCIPGFAMSAALFANWYRHLPPEVEVCAVEPAGKGSRINEKPPSSIDAYVTDILRSIAHLLDQPYAIYGYSLGGVVAFELTRRIRREGHPLPLHLLLGAALPPQRIGDPQDIQLVDRMLEELQASTLELSAQAHHHVLSEIQNMDRAGQEILKSYSYRPEHPLTCPITHYAGLSDRLVPSESANDWLQHTNASVHLHYFSMGHFFMLETTKRGRVQAMISQLLSSLMRE